MSINNRDLVLSVLRENISLSNSSIARLLVKKYPKEFEGKMIDSIRRYVSKLRKKNKLFSTKITSNDFSIKQDGKDANIVAVSQKRIQSLEELIEFFKIDLNKWTIKKWECSSYESHTNIKQYEIDGKVHTEHKVVPLYRVWAQLQENKPLVLLNDVKLEIIQELKEYSPKIQKINYKQDTKRKPCLLEINIFDLHFGKLAWSEETGVNYDIKIAREVFFTCLFQLLEQSKNYNIEKILFPVGNDFFNVDNKLNTTSAGTPQDEDTRWKKTFKLGRQLIIDAIEHLRQIAPVDVLIVPGNHDCYSEDTEVLTQTGWKKYVDIQDTDLIGTLNIATKEVEFQPFTNLVVYDYVGDMIHFRNRYIDCLVSPNHRMLRRIVGSDDYDYEQAASLQHRHGYYFRLNGKINKQDVPIDDNWLRLFAWLNTDGSITDTSFVIYQSKNTGQDKIERILSELGIGYHKSISTSVVKEICGRKLKKTPLPCATYTLNSTHTSQEHLEFLRKHIPDKYTLPAILYQCSERQIDVYVSSFIDGDGTRKYNNTTWAMVYGQSTLLSQLQALLVQASYSTHLNFYRNNQCRMYLNKSFENTRIKKKHVSTVPYSGKIWCLSVPNKNFITRRNGKISIQGNSERTFYLGDALECWYHKCPDVNIDNSPKVRKYYKYGKCLIGYTHGRDEKIYELPHIMASEEPNLWADTKYREWHLGEIHHKKEIKWISTEEFKGVTVRFMRSLSGTDAWHYSKGYVSALRAGEGFIWDKENGLICQFTASI